MLYLLKGSRVREYHQQNIAILGAAEGEVIEVAYNRRWVQPDLALEPGTGCAIVFADSPYEYFVPVRFAVLAGVEETEARVALTCRLGAFVRPGAREALNERWADADPARRPGNLFLFEGENPGLVGPRGQTEIDEAWREAVAGLHGNRFFERTTVARLVDVVDDGGREIDGGHAVAVGSLIRARLEVRSPFLDDEELELLLDVEPRGSVELLDDPVVPANGVADLDLKVVAPGPASVGLGFGHEPLLSSRPTFVLTAESPTQVVRPLPAGPGIGDVAGLRALTARLRRDTDIDDATWVGLYQDVFLGWAPRDPVLLAGYARHAYDVEEYEECYRALKQVPQRLPDEDYLFLLATLRTGRDESLDNLIERIDLKHEDRFDQFLAALDGIPQAPLHQLLDLLPNKLLGEDKTIRFLERAWKQVLDVDVACRIAENTAYADPERGAGLLLDRWPDPATMPVRALELVVDWEARRGRLGPYLDAAVAQANEGRRWDDLATLADKARRLLAAGTRADMLARIGQHLLASGHADRSRQGFGIVYEAVHEAANLGLLDTAADFATVAVAHAALAGEDELQAAAAELKTAVDTAITQSERFRTWQLLRDESELARLVPRFRGKVLHLVGGKPRDWRSTLLDGLELADLRWHETEKERSANIAWAGGLQGDRDIVVVVTDAIGHDTSGPLRQLCGKRDIPYLHASTRLRDVIAALDGLGDG